MRRSALGLWVKGAHETAVPRLGRRSKEQIWGTSPVKGPGGLLSEQWAGSRVQGAGLLFSLYVPGQPPLLFIADTHSDRAVPISHQLNILRILISSHESRCT